MVYNNYIITSSGKAQIPVWNLLLEDFFAGHGFGRDCCLTARDWDL